MKVLKFGAIWCSGCLVMGPRWKEIEAENEWLETEYYDVDENEDLVKKYDLKDFPTFIFLDKAGTVLEKMFGEIDKKVLVQKINEYKDK